MPHPLDSAIVKVNWAKEHIGNLNGLIESFYNSKPYEIGSEEDVDRGERRVYLVKVTEVPVAISLAGGDIIHNLRSALDHAAFQFVYKDTGGKGIPSNKDPFKHVYFPIFDGAQEYINGKMRNISGAGQKSIDAIDATEPYKGGKGHRLWQIHRMDILDKHRLALMAFGGSENFPYICAVAALPRPVIIPQPPGPERPIMQQRFIIRGKSLVCPLKVGRVLHIEPLDFKPDQKLTFTLHVAFNETVIIECEPVIKVLHVTANLVGNIIESFTPFF